MAARTASTAGATRAKEGAIWILKTGEALAPVKAARGDFEAWFAAGLGVAGGRGGPVSRRSRRSVARSARRRRRRRHGLPRHGHRPRGLERAVRPLARRDRGARRGARARRLLRPSADRPRARRRGCEEPERPRDGHRRAPVRRGVVDGGRVDRGRDDARPHVAPRVGRATAERRHPARLDGPRAPRRIAFRSAPMGACSSTPNSIATSCSATSRPAARCSKARASSPIA